MDLTPKLLAAADMCAAGEDVNLDELAFLLRYAADEMVNGPAVDEQHEALLAATRRRLTARADLLRIRGPEIEAIPTADIPALLALDESLDQRLVERFPASTLADSDRGNATSTPFPSDRFRSGPDDTSDAG